MSAFGDIAVRILSDPTPFEKGLASATVQGEKFTKQIQNAFGNMSSNIAASLAAVWTNPAALGIMAATSLFNALVGLEEQSRKAAAAQGALERHFQLTNAAAAGLQFQAMATGMNMEDLDHALLKVSARLGETEHSGHGVSKALERLGLSQAELMGMGIDEKLAVIGDALKGVSNAGERAAIAHQLLGRQAHQLNQILRDGSEGLERSRADAERYGLAMGEVTKQIRTAELLQKRADAAARALSASSGSYFAGQWAQLKTDFINFTAWITGQEQTMRAASQAQFREDAAREAGERLRPGRELVDKMREQVDDLMTFQSGFAGIGEAQAKVEKAIHEGLIPLGNDAADARRQAIAVDRLTEIDHLLNQSVTSAERFDQALGHLNQAWDMGLFGEDAEDALDNYNRALKQAMDEFDRAQAHSSDKLAAGMVVGVGRSAAAISFVNQASISQEASPQETIAERTARLVEISNQQLEVQRQQLEAARNPAQGQPAQLR